MLLISISIDQVKRSFYWVRLVMGTPVCCLATLPGSAPLVPNPAEFLRSRLCICVVCGAPSGRNGY